MIDLHCHLLPGVDDGARTMTDALALARAAVANGIREAVLTPHVHHGVFDNSLSRLLPVFVQFQAELQAAEIPLTVHLGGEIRLHPDAFDMLALGELPMLGALGKDRLLLLEFPDGQIPVGEAAACRMFADQGVRLVIAHPERNKEVMRDPNRIKPFVDAGCLLQLTAASVIGRFGAPALKTAHQLLARGWVHLVASDAHNLHARPPLMGEARAALMQRYGIGIAHRLTEETPGQIVSGRAEAVPARARAA